MIDQWSGLADLLANMIEKYADVIDLENLPAPMQECTQAESMDSTDDKIKDIDIDDAA